MKRREMKEMIVKMSDILVKMLMAISDLQERVEALEGKEIK